MLIVEVLLFAFKKLIFAPVYVFNVPLIFNVILKPVAGAADPLVAIVKYALLLIESVFPAFIVTVRLSLPLLYIAELPVPLLPG